MAWFALVLCVLAAYGLLVGVVVLEYRYSRPKAGSARFDALIDRL